MTMEKSERKKIFNEIKDKELKEFRKLLPIEEYLFPKLFDYVDQKLSDNQCNNDFTFTSEFCKNNNINIENLQNWFVNQSQCCDCEILNLEDSFEYLLPRKKIEINKPKLIIQKLNILKTDSGFEINKIPIPWILKESVSNNVKKYTFQFGKGTNLLVNIEESSILKNIDDENYWKTSWLNETELNEDFENIIVEYPNFENYKSILVKTKNWTPVFIYLKHNINDGWFLKVKTELSRLKGDLKEIEKLITNIGK
jgi:hypothetical protein